MFVVRAPDGECAIELTGGAASATVDDLTGAIAARLAHNGQDVPSLQLSIDGVVLDPCCTLDRAGVANGVVVELQPEGARSRPVGTDKTAAARLEVIGGCLGGTRIDLPAGHHVLGRNGDVVVADGTVSRHHCKLDVTAGGTVTIQDVGSVNGTWLNGKPMGQRQQQLHPTDAIRLGATELRVRARASARSGNRAPAHGTVPFNRPPRAMPQPPQGTIRVPAAPTTAASGLPVSVASIVVPLAMAAILVVVFHNVIWGLFSLLGPIMFAGTWIEQRRRGHRSTRRDQRRWQRELNAFGTALSAAAVAERARLRTRLPDPAEVGNRAVETSTRLWERRPSHDDWMLLCAGTGNVRWEPSLSKPTQPSKADDEPSAEIAAHVEHASVLADVPVGVELSGGAIVGVVGDRAAALALARSLLVQAAGHHGPADLTIVVCADRVAAPDWDWARWLPHSFQGSMDRRLVFDDATDADTAVTELLSARDPDDRGEVLVVVDDARLTERRRSALRRTLQAGTAACSGIVVAATEGQLPSTCTAVCSVTSTGAADLRYPAGRDDVEAMLIAGLTREAALRAARALARFEDPDDDGVGNDLPRHVELAALLDSAPPTVGALSDRWDIAGTDPPPVAVIGTAKDGPLEIDLAIDGPHALVAGTTGAGKSELLRTFVASLATSSPPETLSFVLVDFKGGSAFDRCADLPHVVGLITDLDEHLIDRAVRGLDAELRHREAVFRSAATEDVAAYRRAGSPAGPLPRLVVVIDEFATLAAEHPDVLDAFVSVAQRGRAMGVHLVLATQRPTGSVNDHIRANTNLRIALRMTDRADSVDVIDAPDAASIGRRQPGRALARFGPGELVVFQAARSTGAAVKPGAPAIDLAPVGLAGADTRLGRALRHEAGARVGHHEEREARAPASERTSLDQLVDTIVATAAARDAGAPRRPWPEPLRAAIRLDSLGAATAGDVAFAVADDPDHQRQFPIGWNPSRGNLLLIGVTGSGTTTALASVGHALAAAFPAETCHLYALDFGAGGLAALADLPHTGAVIGAAETERQQRLLRFLANELHVRRSTSDTVERPRLVVLLDGVGSFLATWNDPMVPVADLLGRLLDEGSDLGIHVAMAAERPGAAPMAWTSTIGQRVAFRLADATDYGLLGLSPRAVPPLPPGRAVWVESGLVAQVALPPEHLRRCRSELGPAKRPVTIETLPANVAPAMLPPATCP
ncbi:MAG: FtsK/SpoIIIE domain-containing protein, partial [Acidimicrobiales bacterium]